MFPPLERKESEEGRERETGERGYRGERGKNEHECWEKTVTEGMAMQADHKQYSYRAITKTCRTHEPGQVPWETESADYSMLAFPFNSLFNTAHFQLRLPSLPFREPDPSQKCSHFLLMFSVKVLIFSSGCLPSLSGSRTRARNAYISF